MPWARDGGAAFVHLSDDGGAVWHRTVELDTRPFVGGYGMRGAVALPEGRLMLPLCDIPAYRRVFALFSEDRGENWGPAVDVAVAPDRCFEEPCALALPSGRILLLLRENRSRTLYRVISDDAGRTWSAPAPTGIEGYPAHLLALPDGRIVCTYGRRTPDYGIRAVLSNDDGTSWAIGDTVDPRRATQSRPRQ